MIKNQILSFWTPHFPKQDSSFLHNAVMFNVEHNDIKTIVSRLNQGALI